MYYNPIVYFIFISTEHFLERLITLNPCILMCFITDWFNFSLYNCAALELYFCWASVVVQWCWLKKACCESNPKNKNISNFYHLGWILKKYLHINMSHLTAFALPPNCIPRSWTQVQFTSNWVDLTKERWTPSDRWTAEQSMQMKTPYVTLDQVGALAPQSKHVCK